MTSPAQGAGGHAAPVVVVGGGISGLTAALRLSQAGIRVHVYEKAERTGGVLGTADTGDALLESGANGFLGSAEDGALDLADELGVPVARAAAAARKRWILAGGELCQVPLSPRQLWRTPLVSTRGKLRALLEPFHRPAGEDETVYDFARRRLGDEIARNVVAPFVTGVFAGDARKLGVASAFPGLADLEQQGGLIRGGLRRVARSRKRRPARLWAPERGMEALILALGQRLADSIRTGAAVRSLLPGHDGVDVALGGGETVRARAVVLTCPAPVSADLIGPFASRSAALLHAIPYVPVAVAQLVFRREHIDHPLDGFGFLTRADEPIDVLGCVFESTLWPNRAGDGRVLLRCILGGDRRPDIVGESEARIAERAIAAVSPVLGISADPERARVVRWPRAIPQYTPGHRARIERVDAELAPHRIALGGNACRGVSVNQCVADARVLLSRVSAMVAAIVVLLAAAGSTGCSRPAPRPAVPGDAGHATASAPADSRAAAEVSAPRTGTALVRVTWKSPPAAILRSPGLSACGSRLRAPLSVHAAGGVHDAIVVVDDAPPAAADEAHETEPQDAATAAARLGIEDCRGEPAVVVAGPRQAVDVVDRDERPYWIHLARPPAWETTTSAPLRVLGHTARFTGLEPGLHRVDVGRDRGAAYVYVTAPGQRAVVTDQRGQARFTGVSAGAHQVTVVHAPLRPGASPVTARGRLQVHPGRGGRPLIVDLSAAAAAGAL